MKTIFIVKCNHDEHNIVSFIAVCCGRAAAGPTRRSAFIQRYLLIYDYPLLILSTLNQMYL